MNEEPMNEEVLRRLMENEKKLLDLRRVTKDLEDRRVAMAAAAERLEALQPPPHPEDHDPAD